ncbi:hypothetical protein ET475_15495 [Microbacterium protaetiae]|uniref:Peptidoglycan-binding protein n=1 Tax=Microbacterium protaetiae TaxID=2509458 RepID=A0A4P6EH46_9MICO|nr:peptidoglycan-binding domain-containing protein [Microbacterium protaetiae]QAY61246.1 hypothetical protein ET475_15495 [Microbacterium protaetiae]
MLTLVFGAGWWLALAFESPAQRAAVATAPPPGPVLADVSEGVLAKTISARGTIQDSTVVTRVLPAPDATTVVTGRPVARGQVVSSGESFITLNGRPVFALVGKFPFYRDLEHGSSGPDVEQLQRALRISVTGVYDGATAAAVSSMYARAHASAPDVVPASALIVIPKAMRLTSAPTIGDVLSADASASFSSGNLVARVGVSSSIAEGIETGMKVQLTTTGQTVDGTVTAVDRDGDDAKVAMVPVKPFATAQDGRAIVAVIVLREVAPKGLTVPSTAVIGAGATSARVLKQQTDGSFLAVAVTEVGELDGTSAIVATDGDLVVGDRVRVG